MQAPEISGVIFLSNTVYGHIKEAESIVHRVCGRVPLKELMEHDGFSTLFARLVAVRMSLSSILTPLMKTLDKTSERLHCEQSMLLKALRSVPRRQIDWTQPGYSISL